MKILEVLRLIQIAFGALLITSAFPASAGELSPELLQSWEETWNRVIDNAMNGYLERAANGSLSSLEKESQAQALEELAGLMYPSVSWAALGDAVIRNMRAECGDDVLTGMEPYFVHRDPGRIDPEVAQAYGLCAQRATQTSIELVVSAIQANLERVTDIHAKYGIKYP